MCVGGWCGQGLTMVIILSQLLVHVCRWVVWARFNYGGNMSRRYKMVKENEISNIIEYVVKM